ncbi:MAG: hypothetical protein LC659_01805 [Myxococcales bacterium]|nr:hypothetical protein [Myxococcales bacterium]
MKRTIVALLTVAGCAHGKSEPPPQPAPHEHAAAAVPGPAAKLYDNLGDYHRAVSTKAPEAQRFFDQGLRLTYAFNHEEAQRSFDAAAALDPSCAACYWGSALVLGPNYNQPAGADRAKKAVALLKKANAAPNASPVERALIGALQKRYVDPPPAADDQKGQAALDEAYASAMRDVAKRYPDDDDVQVLFAESMMDLRPWRLWEPDGKAAPGTDEIVATLEKVLARAPQHPGANHYYIHAVEASQHPEKALAAADRIGAMLKLVPADMWKQMPEVSFSIEAPALSLVRFGRWDAVLKEPAPPAELPMPTILHHYARGRALAALGKLDDADAEAAAMQKVLAALPKTALAGFAPGDAYGTVALEIVRGDVACRRGKIAEGLALLRKAVDSADAFPYAEPPDWYYPPRQTLGAWLLRAKKPADAARVLEEDLKRNPENGWALTGLREALRAQNRPTAAVDARLAKAWRDADVKVASSDF